MQEIVIISGKGGTGKTSVASALAFIEPQNLVMADCDVDAADLHLILQPENQISEDFYSGVKAIIDPKMCTNCGLCKDICCFRAIEIVNANHHIIPLNCEGCGYCYQVCPAQAISLPTQKVGVCHLATTRIGCQMVHAALGIGADNSGKLVAKVKKQARETAESTHKTYILVDGSPGIGCPVISSLSGADFAMLVTEPTLSGLADLKRVWQLAAKFNIPTGCIINKADLNPELCARITDFLLESHILHVDNLPYDNDFSQAITLGKSLVEFNEPKWLPRFTAIWNTITKEIL